MTLYGLAMGGICGSCQEIDEPDVFQSTSGLDNSLKRNISCKEKESNMVQSVINSVKRKLSFKENDEPNILQRPTQRSTALDNSLKRERSCEENAEISTFQHNIMRNSVKRKESCAENTEPSTFQRVRNSFKRKESCEENTKTNVFQRVRNSVKRNESCEENTKTSTFQRMRNSLKRKETCEENAETSMFQSVRNGIKRNLSFEKKDEPSFLERMTALGNNHKRKETGNDNGKITATTSFSGTNPPNPSDKISEPWISSSSHDKSVSATTECQRLWKPPQPIKANNDDDDDDVDDVFEDIVSDLGALHTDAALYIIKEKDGCGTKIHNVLHMPSHLPRISHSSNNSPNTFNLLMVDVSGSMSHYWKNVEDGWNSHVAPHLKGRTVIYTFGSSVTFRRAGASLERKDFDAGGTDLTGALQTIVNEVYLCQEKHVNVFIITDGDHNITEVEPPSVIDQMKVPHDKICTTYILGAGNEFPVQYSVDIRSHLHNGSSNLPHLFWAKQREDIVEQMIDIANRMTDGSSITMKLEVAGSPLPGLSTTNTFHLREWVYFPCETDQLKELNVRFKGHKGVLHLKPQEITMDVLEEIFHQWNSVIIQLNSKKETIPEGILKFIERVFMTQIGIIEGNGTQSISQRLQKKKVKAHEVKFRMELSKVKVILTTDKYKNQLELADNILSTTVTKPKYQIKSLQLKGHTDGDYERDCQEFMKVYNQRKDQIQSLSVVPDDCCRITMTSTVSDLQDPDFITLLNESNKFEFLKEFTITGIPVFAPIRDSLVLNPWSFSVQAMLKSPYTIMSQVAMETFADTKPMAGEHKVLQLKYDDDSTCYNAVVPVFPPSVAQVMQPFVKTRLYAMCVTFATIKNPHVVDGNIHMATLAVLWVHCLYENPTQPRPEHAQIRMDSIEATAALYIDQQRYANYMRILKEDTPQALMTESTLMVDNKPIKCESLIKPIFFLEMIKKYDSAGNSVDMARIIELILMEYIGRCLSNYKSDVQSTLYTEFFAESLADKDKKKDWAKKYIADAKAGISGQKSTLLRSHYTLEKLGKAAKIMADGKVDEVKQELTTQIPLKVDVVKVEHLRNVSGAGDVSWSTLKVFAKEIGLQEAAINKLFSDESVFIYTAHAIKYRSSRERLSNPMADFATSHASVAGEVQKESTQDVIKEFRKELISIYENSWLEAYFDAHSEIVKPMTQQEIVSEAQQRGIKVTNDTFDQVYKKYRPTTGLLSNACQTRACPYYLHPNKSYNQHATIERTRGQLQFVHRLHRIAYQNRDSNLPTALMQTNIPKKDVNRLAKELDRLMHIYKGTH